MIKVIAEAGLNWTTFDEAVEYAEKAKEIGADIIKYQYVKEDSPYSQMNQGEWKALKGYCDKIKIEFMCTPSTQEILEYLQNIEVKRIKIGSDKACKLKDKYIEALNQCLFNIKPRYQYYKDLKYLISDGYYDNEIINMYCVSLYPCDPKFIDFDKMSNEKYIGFSDHTTRYDKEWCNKIKACKNIEYVEKHFKLKDGVIDDAVSLNYKQMKEFIRNMKCV
jgi:sialic acid synthase SpsE